MILELSFDILSIEQYIFKFSILVHMGMENWKLSCEIVTKQQLRLHSISTPLCKNYSSRNRPYKNPKKSGHESRSPVVTEKSSLKSVCFI